MCWPKSYFVNRRLAREAQWCEEMRKRHERYRFMQVWRFMRENSDEIVDKLERIRAHVDDLESRTVIDAAIQSFEYESRERAEFWI